MELAPFATSLAIEVAWQKLEDSFTCIESMNGYYQSANLQNSGKLLLKRLSNLVMDITRTLAFRRNRKQYD